MSFGTNHHYLKCHPGPFHDVWLGLKLFEVRKDDRHVEVGDLMSLAEWHPHVGFTGRRVSMIPITYKLPGGQYGVEPGYCILGFQPITESQKHYDAEDDDSKKVKP